MLYVPIVRVRLLFACTCICFSMSFKQTRSGNDADWPWPLCVGYPAVLFAHQHVVPFLRVNQGRIVDDDSAQAMDSQTAQSLKERTARKHSKHQTPLQDPNGDHLLVEENVTQQHTSTVQQLEAFTLPGQPNGSPASPRRRTLGEGGERGGGPPAPPIRGAPMSLGSSAIV
jgi:hypothetical protein